MVVDNVGGLNWSFLFPMGRSNDQAMELSLRTAIMEYVDKGMVDELMCDIKWIFKSEEKDYDLRLKTCQKARRIICGND